MNYFSIALAVTGLVTLGVMYCGKIPISGFRPTIEASSAPVLGGADVVAYFSLEAGAAPVMGSADHSYTFESKDLLNGANSTLPYTFWFSSEENKAAFAKDPWKYAPKYGGFCAFGVAFETMSGGGGGGGWPWSRDYMGPPGTAAIWKIYKGSLYIAFIQGAMDGFLTANPDDNIAQADKRWAEWWGGQQAGPFNVECLGPMEQWIKHSCDYSPQAVPGVQTKKPLNEKCVAALNEKCKDVHSQTMGPCDQCLDKHTQELIDAGCPARPANQGRGVAQVVEKVWCK